MLEGLAGISINSERVRLSAIFNFHVPARNRFLHACRIPRSIASIIPSQHSNCVKFPNYHHHIPKTSRFANLVIGTSARSGQKRSKSMLVKCVYSQKSQSRISHLAYLRSLFPKNIALNTQRVLIHMRLLSSRAMVMYSPKSRSRFPPIPSRAVSTRVSILGILRSKQ